MKAAYNKRIQSDQNARYAFILTTDARRYFFKIELEKSGVMYE